MSANYQGDGVEHRRRPWPRTMTISAFTATLVLATGLVVPALAQPNCPPGVDITTAFARGDQVLGYIGIDVDTDMASLRRQRHAVAGQIRCHR